nr:AraC family transcriptional regulator [Acinetobacter seifertii]
MHNVQRDDEAIISKKKPNLSRRASDGAHFSKIFKKTYGISPKEFREGMSV